MIIRGVRTRRVVRRQTCPWMIIGGVSARQVLRRRTCQVGPVGGEEYWMLVYTIRLGLQHLPYSSVGEMEAEWEREF
jgi:hypothetical protein